MDQCCSSFRRLFQVAALFGVCLVVGGCKDEESATPRFHETAEAVPVTGVDVHGAPSFDTAIKALLQRWNVAGATVAIAKDGHLILARGYGYANYESGALMQPDATLRVASISKFITAAAILQLKDLGRLNLDERVLDILTEYSVPPGGDARLRDITVRHLLQHSGGWDRGVAGDPTFQNSINAGMFEIALNVNCRDQFQAALSLPLQFTPGTRSSYSNLGFCVLGRVIERVTGLPYEVYVRDHVLAPLDVHAMSIGYERLQQRGPLEPRYYAFDGERKVQSIFPGEGLVAAPYGGHSLAAIDSSGGWIASAIDLARVMTAVDGSRAQAISPAAYAEMIANPHLPESSAAEYWDGLGVSVGPTPATWSKNGRLSGAQSLLVHRRDGYSWVVLTNTGPEDLSGFEKAIVAAIRQGFDENQTDGFGSTTDLFSQYPSPPVPARYPQ